MTRTGCEAAVKLAAKSVDDVRDCRADYKSGTAEVTYHPSKTGPEAIAKVISEKTRIRGPLGALPT
jgi:copper chaperone CopZ